MPELPEVETCKKGLRPLLCQKTITAVDVRAARLREPLDAIALSQLIHCQITEITRRAKYLIININREDIAVLVHLGMSGSLRVLPQTEPIKKHDHIIITLNDGYSLRYHDPRRFGLFTVFHAQKPHRLLQHLGIEPLDDSCTGDVLHQHCQKRKIKIKSLIMNQNIIVGIGNIYATEALFLSGIRPDRPAQTLSAAECASLMAQIKTLLTAAIARGGTTLRDFSAPDGHAGYFQQQLHVYGKSGQHCPKCGNILEDLKISNRGTVYCPHCQR
ncbi:bifunctional DNA-formamidopyrimidine glycosylase/DNA-(apurinic or apyrimidinic site) lyase [Dichelobacter nodosus]|uniref:bifunctional DNA-formamidopyrimidine glycosylase/DNA-(apurinic or apyrimidinic site) lyase n=1 Tax=Dichelobacter nodosus TaxID=870 RepID=UPI00068314AB|nr:bifunctional DNA-formamidopyrimidine glycosylase/DNA-(apurinic or apyrimidinic site) lyase [Dichelobacter nodosus]AXM45909.1 bifunctional DNA-formamidopyrimidine glycosylase/DNA-(apurinic or apyrimidinic site) lyase [Dichelobacter nodosus]KNZ39076.1 adenylate kinase [Dichelobacter nodosus]TGA64638.1 bifunctional DNA-formamidopyrimidine glycosylase/DNA-(apurinic or apyrimidinic site) lyase [Dichelobacter nodosus]